MPPEPVPADPGWDEDLAWLDRDPMTAAEREAWLDRLCQLDDDPADAPQEYWDPESCAPPPGQDELTEQELAGIAEAARRLAHPELLRDEQRAHPVPHQVTITLGREMRLRIMQPLQDQQPLAAGQRLDQFHVQTRVSISAYS